MQKLATTLFCTLNPPLGLSEKLRLYPNLDIIVNSMTKAREEWHSLVLNGTKLPWYPVFLFLFFCLELTVRNNAWIRTNCVTLTIINSKVPFWKLLDHRYVQSYFSTITWYLERHLTVEDFMDLDQHLC